MTCKRMEARSKAFPALMSEGVASALATLAPPLPVRAPMTASRPTKVDMTRPGWIGLR